MEIRGPSGKFYVIGSELGVNDKFKLYQCSDGDNDVCILKIARKAAWNGLLDREAFLLQLLAKEAEELEIEYEKVKKDDKKLNYHFFFPQLIESFTSPEQENSRINIVSFKHIAKKLSDLTPIGHLTSRENVRVDPRTSAWILGKLLTMIAFTKNQSVLINNITGDNVLINRDQHYVTIFDWTEASLGSGEISSDLVVSDIIKATKEVTKILSYDYLTEKLPEDKQLEGNDYEKYLSELSSGRIKDVVQAHKQFYQIVLSAWPREFYKFTTHTI